MNSPSNPPGLAAHSRLLRDAAWLPYVAPFALFMLALALRGSLEAPVRQLGFDPRWLYALQVVPATLALAFFWSRLDELRTLPRGFEQWALALGIGFAVFIVWIAANADWMRIGEPVATFIGADGDQRRWDLLLLRSFGAVVLVPIIEEIFWRSFLMRWIDSRDFLARPPAATTLFALVASSAVFALAHDLWLAGLIAGLAYGWLYMRTGNLWTAIIAHGITNLALAVWVVSNGRWEYW